MKPVKFEYRSCTRAGCFVFKYGVEYLANIINHARAYLYIDYAHIIVCCL